MLHPGLSKDGLEGLAAAVEAVAGATYPAAWSTGPTEDCSCCVASASQAKLDMMSSSFPLLPLPKPVSFRKVLLPPLRPPPCCTEHSG